MSLLILQHSRTKMFLAEREVPASEMSGAKSNGASMHYRWTWNMDEAHRFDPDSHRGASVGEAALFVNCSTYDLIPAPSDGDAAS